MWRVPSTASCGGPHRHRLDGALGRGSTGSGTRGAPRPPASVGGDRQPTDWGGRRRSWRHAHPPPRPRLREPGPARTTAATATDGRRWTRRRRTRRQDRWRAATPACAGLAGAARLSCAQRRRLPLLRGAGFPPAPPGSPPWTATPTSARRPCYACCRPWPTETTQRGVEKRWGWAGGQERGQRKPRKGTDACGVCSSQRWLRELGHTSRCTVRPP